jgi:hypothetical protein
MSKVSELYDHVDNKVADVVVVAVLVACGGLRRCFGHLRLWRDNEIEMVRRSKLLSFAVLSSFTAQYSSMPELPGTPRMSR